MRVKKCQYLHGTEAYEIKTEQSLKSSNSYLPLNGTETHLFHRQMWEF